MLCCLLRLMGVRGLRLLLLHSKLRRYPAPLVGALSSTKSRVRLCNFVTRTVTSFFFFATFQSSQNIALLVLYTFISSFWVYSDLELSWLNGNMNLNGNLLQWTWYEVCSFETLRWKLICYCARQRCTVSEFNPLPRWLSLSATLV